MSQQQSLQGQPAAPAAADRVAALYEKHVPAMVGLAYLLTGSLPAAEDLAQEAFLRVVGRMAFIRDSDAVPAYLRRAVINLWKNDVRRQRREQAYRAAQRGGEPAEGVDVATGVAVRQALLRLSPRQRAVIVLRYYADLPEREIAELLRCRAGTVKSLTSRAIAALRAEFGDRLEMR